MFSLPPELLTPIFQFLTDDVASLASCTLVNQSWLINARPVLFRSIKLQIDGPNPRMTPSGVLEFLNSNPHLSTYIRDIHLVGPILDFNEAIFESDDDNPFPFASFTLIEANFVASVLSSIPHIEGLKISNYQLPNEVLSSQSPLLSKFSLRRLALEFGSPRVPFISLMSLKEVLLLMEMFSAVGTLSIRCWACKSLPPDLTSTSTLSIVCPPIQTLSIGSVFSQEEHCSSILRWLYLLDPERVPQKLIVDSDDPFDDQALIEYSTRLPDGVKELCWSVNPPDDVGGGRKRPGPNLRRFDALQSLISVQYLTIKIRSIRYGVDWYHIADTFRHLPPSVRRARVELSTAFGALSPWKPPNDIDWEASQSHYARLSNLESLELGLGLNDWHPEKVEFRRAHMDMVTGWLGEKLPHVIVSYYRISILAR